MPSPTGTGIERSLHRLAVYALLGGSTSLLPLPVVDDWAHAWVRRRMILEIGRPKLGLGPSTTRILMNRGREEVNGGCLRTLLRTPITVTAYVLGRIFRKIFYFLAIKESTDRASLLFHEGYLLTVAATASELHPWARRGEPAAIRQLAFAVVETLDHTDTSPVRKLVIEVMRGSRRLLFTAARRLRRFLRRRRRETAEELVEEEAEVLEQPAWRLARLLKEQWPYFQALEARFRKSCEARRVLRGGPSDQGEDYGTIGL